MKWRSELVLALSLLGLTAPTSLALAQATATPAADPSCACHAPPDSSDSPGGTPGKAMLIFGAAGLAVLSGVPFGGTSLQGLPFAAAPTEALPTGVWVAEAPGGLESESPAATPAAPAGVTLASAPAGVPVIPEMGAQPGMVPPQTATHLPLLAAAGLLMVGGGGLLARRDARERRRRRRFVAL